MRNSCHHTCTIATPPTVTCEEYELLQGLNRITLAKYSDMAKLAGGLTDVSTKLNEKCNELWPECLIPKRLNPRMSNPVYSVSESLKVITWRSLRSKASGHFPKTPDSNPNLGGRAPVGNDTVTYKFQLLLPALDIMGTYTYELDIVGLDILACTQCNTGINEVK